MMVGAMVGGSVEDLEGKECDGNFSKVTFATFTCAFLSLLNSRLLRKKKKPGSTFISSPSTSTRKEPPKSQTGSTCTEPLLLLDFLELEFNLFIFPFQYHF